MSTIPSSASFVDLHVGARPVPYASIETMDIIMRTRKVDPDGNVLNTGGAYTVSKTFGKTAVEQGWADDANKVLPNRNGLTVNPNIKLGGFFTYDGTGRLVSYEADGLLYQFSYPDANTILIALGDTTKQITLNSAQQVTGIQTL